MSEIYPIAVPKWGIEMVEGTINTWNKQQGDPVTRGDEVFEMESDKITYVWDAPIDGVLRRVIAEEGEAHPVGALLGIIAAADVDDAAIDAFIAGYGGGEEAVDNEFPAPAEPAALQPAASPGAVTQRSSPSVRKLAQQLGVDLEVVTGTGRRGRITEEDVRSAASEAGDGDQDNVDIIPLSATRKTIARRLSEAKRDIPHFYLTVEYELDGLLAHRAALNAAGKVRVSVNDLVVYCVAQALIKEPRVNVNLVGDDIYQFRTANVSVAIATDDGLYPVTVRSADTMAPAEIASALGKLAEKARSGELARDDIAGGTFTVSNLGMFGVSNFTAIVNPPMGAILALGKAAKKMIVRDEQPAVATVVSATLSCDHRVIDGNVGARFLQVLGEEIAALS